MFTEIQDVTARTRKVINSTRPQEKYHIHLNQFLTIYTALIQEPIQIHSFSYSNQMIKFPSLKDRNPAVLT